MEHVEIYFKNEILKNLLTNNLKISVSYLFLKKIAHEKLSYHVYWKQFYFLFFVRILSRRRLPAWPSLNQSRASYD